VIREDHNLYWKPGGSPLIQNLIPHASSKKADPRFADAGKGDFRLSAGSPALDVGVADGTAALGYQADLEGNPVPAGSAPDMGCFEGKSGTALAFKAENKRKGDYRSPGLRGSLWKRTWNDEPNAFDALGKRRNLTAP
jgi:hypothetical protein